MRGRGEKQFKQKEKKRHEKNRRQDKRKTAKAVQPNLAADPASKQKKGKKGMIKKSAHMEERNRKTERRERALTAKKKKKKKLTKTLGPIKTGASSRLEAKGFVAAGCHPGHREKQCSMRGGLTTCPGEAKKTKKSRPASYSRKFQHLGCN